MRKLTPFPKIMISKSKAHQDNQKFIEGSTLKLKHIFWGFVVNTWLIATPIPNNEIALNRKTVAQAALYRLDVL